MAGNGPSMHLRSRSPLTLTAFTTHLHSYLIPGLYTIILKVLKVVLFIF